MTDEWNGISELQQEVSALRRANELSESRPSARTGPAPSNRTARVRRGPTPRLRRLRLVVLVGAAIVAVIAVRGLVASSRSFPLPSRASLAGMGTRARIVAFAGSQVGYSTSPANTYCNKFSAYWRAGSAGCPGGELAEEWCADFAAWAWRRAGVRFAYGFGPDEINARAVSFYQWGIAHGTWHPVNAGYRAAPGDVAVYGLSLGSYPTATHVALVTAQPAGQRGPDVINGDGDKTGFSVVEVGNDQLHSDTKHHNGSPLAGYVSPA